MLTLFLKSYLPNPYHVQAIQTAGIFLW